MAADLPPRVETVVTCELLPAQRRLYEQVLEACRRRVFAAVEERGLGRSHLTVLDALLKLRQICCHPQLLKMPGNQVRASAKLELFRELVADLSAEGHRILVFSQFVEMLQILARELARLGLRYEYLDGQTRDRRERIARFQESKDIPVFLMSLKAGGLGLNLTAANYVIHYDPWWNPAVEDQATDRAHRIGQEKPVFSYKLITRGTVEEKMLVLQERKRTPGRRPPGRDHHRGQAPHLRGLAGTFFQGLRYPGLFLPSGFPQTMATLGFCQDGPFR